MRLIKPQYMCPRCGYNTGRRSNYCNHLKKKKICSAVLNDVIPTLDNVIVTNCHTNIVSNSHNTTTTNNITNNTTTTTTTTNNNNNNNNYHTTNIFNICPYGREDLHLVIAVLETLKCNPNCSLHIHKGAYSS